MRKYSGYYRKRISQSEIEKTDKEANPYKVYYYGVLYSNNFKNYMVYHIIKTLRFKYLYCLIYIYTDW